MKRRTSARNRRLVNSPKRRTTARRRTSTHFDDNIFKIDDIPIQPSPTIVEKSDKEKLNNKKKFTDLTGFRNKRNF